MLDLLSKYIGIFGKLHRNQNPKFGMAPHKPILLLAVLDEVERGSISQSCIEVTPELVAAFRAYWRVLVLPDTWIERIANPFRFMVQEGFWELTKNGVAVSTQSLGYNPSLKQLTTDVDGAILAADLWQLLQDRTAVNALKAFLLKEYFGMGIVDIRPQLPDNPIDYEVEILIAEAHSRFRPRVVSADKDETGYFVRHALFPKVVKTLYNDACAVCHLNVLTDDGRSGLVDAAHIMPFGIFHYDDPRNGIAFCKNHHWGFDAGWFSIADDYKILVSPRLQNALIYLTAGVPIALPSQTDLAPARDALVWHRTNVYKR